MGYDIERFVDIVNDGLLCCICRDVLEDPLQAPCEHAFCSTCIRGWLVHEKTCPEDRQQMAPSALRPLFRYMKNDLGQLDIRCKYKSSGCQIIKKLENIEKHEKTCDFRTVQCSSSGCRALVQSRALEQHLKSCEFRTKECQKGCGLSMLDPSDADHSCIAELRLANTVLHSEMICKLDDQRKEMQQRLDSQRRHMVQREIGFQNQLHELKIIVLGLMDEITALKSADKQRRELEQLELKNLMGQAEFGQEKDETLSSIGEL